MKKITTLKKVNKLFHIVSASFLELERISKSTKPVYRNCTLAPFYHYHSIIFLSITLTKPTLIPSSIQQYQFFIFFSPLFCIRKTGFLGATPQPHPIFEKINSVADLTVIIYPYRLNIAIFEKVCQVLFFKFNKILINTIIIHL